MVNINPISLKENNIDYYKKNCSLFSFYSKKENMPSPILSTNSSFTIYPSKSDELTAQYNDILLHSSYKPSKEAKQICNSLQTERFDSFIVFGMGLGYIIKELSNIYTNVPIIVIELNSILLSLLLQKHNYNNITQTHIPLFLLPSQYEIREYLKGEGLKNPQIIHTQVSRSIFDKENIQSIEQEIQQFLSGIKTNEITLKVFKKRWIHNSLYNLIFNSHKIKSIFHLQKKFSNIPALLCCAGPSLFLMLDIIKTLHSKMIIVAVDTAMPLLNSLNIHVDFVCTVDSQYANSKHLHWITIPTHSHYIADIHAHCNIFSATHNNIFITKPVIPLAERATNKSIDMLEVSSGGSVATFAWDVLRTIGIQKIYTVGLDLSYPIPAPHSRGCRFEEDSHITSSRTIPSELQFVNSIYSTPQKKVKTYNNSWVATDERLFVYYQWFKYMHTIYPHIQTFTFSKDSANIPGIEYVAHENLSFLPSIRTTIDKKMEECATYSTLNQEIIQKNLYTLENECTQYIILLEKTVSLLRLAYKNKLTAQKEKKLQELESELTKHSLSPIIGFFVQDDIKSIQEYSGTHSLHKNVSNAIQLYNAMLYCTKTIKNGMKFNQQ